jgi:hypothetical protein
VRIINEASDAMRTVPPSGPRRSPTELARRDASARGEASVQLVTIRVSGTTRIDMVDHLGKGTWK